MKVFWAWQSDIDGKIGRHFVREALEKAIAALNDSAEIESRPSEESEMHLDHDRKGISGSPDLASTIFEKIRASKVFVADVTPVASTAGGKKISNPNVAIELGFALASLGDKQILLVMNEAFGSRDDLPFDIRHKAGPLLYRLTTEVDKISRDNEEKRFVEELKSALKPYRSDATPNLPALFERRAPFGATGFFAEPNTILATSPNSKIPLEHSMSAGSHLYLRISPKYNIGKPLDLSAMKFARSQLGAFSSDFSPWGENEIWHRENSWGIVEFTPSRSDEQLIGTLTQSFRTGEIWGINTDTLAYSMGSTEFLNCSIVEKVFLSALRRYIIFLNDQMKTPFPIIVESGIVGVLNRTIVASGQVVDNDLKIAQNNVISKGEINKEDDINRYLLKFFEDIYLAAGRQRPNNLNGFPPV